MRISIAINHGPVKRAHAESYLLVMLIAFAGSVILTRAYLEATGYPQLGGGVFHFAHVLWGGLLLFAGALLPLIVYNRRVYLLSAALTGLGVGLFIDEVGKFITASNDYFFPLAAPIIYVFFIATVIIYLRVRTRRTAGSRTQLYRALDRMTDVVDHDLDTRERRELMQRLNAVLTDRAASDDMKALAAGLIEVITDPSLDVLAVRASLWERLMLRFRLFEQRFLPRRVARPLLGIVLILFGLTSLSALLVTLWAVVDAPSRDSALAQALLDSTDLASAGATAVTWLFVLFALQSLIGALVLVSGAATLVGRDGFGTRLAFIAVVVNLTTVSLLSFYYQQFAAVASVMAQFVLLLALARYRQRFVSRSDTADVLSKVLVPPTAREQSVGESAS